MGTPIINRGRGPEIAGARITVYDVLDYLQAGWRYDSDCRALPSPAGRHPDCNPVH